MIGVALLMTLVGLSPALGTFLAGVVLSDSEYRHALESDIDPFKGLLLGLFFISVGASMDFGLLVADPVTILGMALGIMALKFGVLAGIAKAFRMRGTTFWLFGLGLAQAGEFAFVLFGFAASSGVLPSEHVQVLNLVVAVSMLLTPALFIVYERVIAPRASKSDAREADEIDEPGQVVVAGAGRFGIVVTRLLTTNGHRVVAVDHSETRIELLRKVGIRAYYGDATRADLLESAGIEEAMLFVAALDDRERNVELVRHVAEHVPGCRILARALDYEHSFELERAGAHYVEREWSEGAIHAGQQALVELGTHPYKAELQARAFRQHDRELVGDLRQHWTESGFDQGFIGTARSRQEQLASVMDRDRMHERHDSSERGWTPPPKGDKLL